MPKSGQLWQRGLFERSPLLSDYRELAGPLLHREQWPSLADYTALAERERRARAPELAPVSFSPPRLRARRARGGVAIELCELYDGRVAAGEVPCLSQSYHDLCNALVWAAFPRLKRVLHARQFQALQRWVPPGALRLPNRRSREQDALTLFDEGGSVVLASGQGTAVVLFGHALIEHVLFEPSAIHSAALVLSAPEPLPRGRTLFELIDREVSLRLARPAELVTPEFDQTLSIQAQPCASSRDHGRADALGPAGQPG
jgi:hypothetical protein